MNFTKKSTTAFHQSLLLRRVRHKTLLNSTRRLIRGKNNQLVFRNTILHSVIFDINGNNNEIHIDEGSILKNVMFHVRGNNHHIFIGKNCRFNRGGAILFEDSNCSLFIGEESSFEDVHLAVTEPHSRIEIGRDCLFAYDIDVRTGDSHSIVSQESNERINHAKNVTIGNHVWVGAHSIILKGSCIPENSVVATGSVVTKSYSTSGIIIGGNPSRQLKEGINWTRERTYK